MAGFRGSHVALEFLHQSILADDFLSCQISQAVHLHSVRNAANPLAFLLSRGPRQCLFRGNFQLAFFPKPRRRTQVPAGVSSKLSLILTGFAALLFFLSGSDEHLFIAV